MFDGFDLVSQTVKRGVDQPEQFIREGDISFQNGFDFVEVQVGLVNFVQNLKVSQFVTRDSFTGNDFGFAEEKSLKDR